MNSKPSVNDYVVVQTKSERPKPTYTLVKVTSFSGSTINGRLEVNPHIKPQTVSFPTSDIVVNLGASPAPGKVYGVDTSNIYRKTLNHPAFGEVHFMCKPTPSEIKKLDSAMKSLHVKLKKNKLLFLIEDGSTTFEVVDHAYSKYAGMFRMSKNRDRAPSRISVCASANALATIGVDDYEYVLAHELGHALHFHHIKSFPTLDAAWLRAYTNSVTPRIVDRDLTHKLKGLLLSERSVSGSLAMIPEEDMEAAKLCFRWVNTTCGLKAKDLDLLLETGKDQTLTELWPSWELVLRELKPKLTLYSTKSYMELFAESFAYWITGKTLPAKLQSLMDKTVAASRGGSQGGH
jgi:hypothetical protein